MNFSKNLFFILPIVVLLLCSFLAGVGTFVFASSSGSTSGDSSSGGGSSSGGSLSGFNGGVTQVVSGVLDRGDAMGETRIFSGGNVGIVSPAASPWPGQETRFYSNGDGTYNTITYTGSSDYSQGSYSGGSGGGGGYSQGSYSGTGCPSSYTYYNGACYPSSSCSTTGGSGKGGSVTTCSSTPLPSSCVVNGVTVPNGSSFTFYTVGNVPYGETCSTHTVSRTCNAGQFSGSDAGFYSTCVVDDAPQISTITIDAIPPIVRYGEDAEIVWDGGNAEACTVTGYGLTNVTGVTGSADVENVTGESVYTLTCTLGSNTRSANTVLKILPRFQES